MANDILTEIDAFIADTGLSDHRAGIILANNGRLVQRLREGGRIWPETVELIRENLAAERAKRELITCVSPSSDAPSAEAS